MTNRTSPPRRPQRTARRGFTSSLFPLAAAAAALLTAAEAHAGLCGLGSFGCCPQAAPAPACYTAARMQTVTSYRTVYDTVCEPQTSYYTARVTENTFEDEVRTATRTVYRTETREEPYTVRRMVRETSNREQEYTVARPVTVAARPTATGRPSTSPPDTSTS